MWYLEWWSHLEIVSERQKELPRCQPWNLWMPELMPGTTYLWTSHRKRKINLLLRATECIPNQYVHTLQNVSTKVLKYIHKRGRVTGEPGVYSVCYPISLRTPSWSSFSSSVGCWFISPLRQWVLKYGLQVGTVQEKDVVVFWVTHSDSHWMFWLATPFQTHHLTMDRVLGSCWALWLRSSKVNPLESGEKLVQIQHNPYQDSNRPSFQKEKDHFRISMEPLGVWNGALNS